VLLQTEDGGEQITLLFNPFDDIRSLKMKVLAALPLHACLHFVPVDGGGNGRMLFGAQRIYIYGGLVVVVLAPIHEHFSFAKILLHLRDDAVRRFLLQAFRDGTGEGFS
jgi:hypothetical protein